MISNTKILVVIPVYNVGETIIDFLDKIPDYVDKIYLIDDCCPMGTGKIAENSKANTSKLTIIYNKKNLGVGGAVKVGYEKCLLEDSGIIVKIDGDNQMDPDQIKKIVDPIISNKDLDYCKGNRFLEMIEIENYPSIRFYGNIFLSFMSKLSSGYWDIYDPVNGFTAINSNILKKLNFDKIDDGYYFESDMLFNLYLLRAKVKDIPVKIKYFKNSTQNMNIFYESFNFFFKNLNRVTKRIKKTYLLNNFSVGSFFIISFIINFILTATYGGYNYIYHLFIKEFAPTGVVLLSSIFLLLTILSLMIFLIIDNFNNPNK